MEPTLSQGVGYGVIVGLGAFFALMMNVITIVQNKFTKFNAGKVDEFTAASRNIPFGLIICGIVSSWTWSLTLLQSSTESYYLGVSGSYYYGLGGLLQVGIFSVIAAKVKVNANLVTTFAELGYFRFGTWGHLAFLWSGIICNAIVSACILLGGGAVFSAITGISEYAALFLIPLGVAAYVSLGGLRATFISDATHTFILLIFVIIFVFTVYVGSSKIGSPGRMWELLKEVSKTTPVDTNYHGEYLTFRSADGAVYAVRSTITGFGLVACDQAYWSRAIAGKDRVIGPAYFVAALCWFIIPFSLGASLGLSARALSVYPDFPTLSSAEVGAGLCSVASAVYLLGKAGATMMMLMVFLSVTSSFSGELIATSTLISYDIYKKYIRKNATPHEVVRVAKIMVFVWALFSAGLSSAFNAAGIGLGWLFNFLGVATASGVFPIALAFTWSGLTTLGAVVGSIGSMCIALIVWLVTCKAYMGTINVDNLSNDWVSFAGNSAAIVCGGVISIGLSLIFPEKETFEWEDTRNRTILVGESKEAHREHQERLENLTSAEQRAVAHETNAGDDSSLDIELDQEIDQVFLGAQFKKYTILFGITALIFAFVIPVPLSAAPYIWSKKFLAGVVGIIIAWLFVSFSVVIILPIWESKEYLWNLFLVIIGKQTIEQFHNSQEGGDESSGSGSSVEVDVSPIVEKTGA
ncbi:unnamed protein product [Kuraishia capsulata CBS 1993]|uniref:Urea active transporter n=1 Tax=Kuraishia capsulata CBS 1993 TaxID=1382522 RepID=W6MJX1_9ASCO|nr:uncharacterized protein KUCA_T00002564001 [Kuraishia capsulata CBS 1993]CDK26591.1 unnamed protein product [Kuraishia capsulata CBS 1993]